MNKKIDLSREKREELVKLIQGYFLDERDEEIGDLAASIFLDFIVKNIGPEFYNKGVEDAYNLMKDRTEDLLSLEIVKRN